MGRQLTLIRHAKSSWNDSHLCDFDRPLNKRGILDAPLMGRIIEQNLSLPDFFLCSPARRAVMTAKAIAKEMACSIEKIVYIEKIYEAGLAVLLEIITGLKDQYKNVFICGHNPSFTSLLNYLTRVNLSNLPTCAVASIHFTNPDWSEIEPASGNLIFYDYPKSHY